VPGIAAPVLAALTQFAVGGLWAQTLVPLPAIQRGFFAICSLCLLSAEVIVLWVLGATAAGPTLFTTRAGLLGLAFVGMLLGHSYLNAPHLPLRLIDRLSRFFLWAVLARGCYPVVTGALLWAGGGLAPGLALVGLQEHFLLVILRLGVGVGGSLTVALVIRNCLRLPNVQAATGFYYVAMLTVFLGEVLGGFLLALANLPL